MAPAPRSSAANDDATSQNGQFQPFKSWLAVYGDAEYAQYKKEAATPHLTYEDWASSDHPLGPYLYKLTLDAWDDESTSDEELEQPVKSAARDLAEREPAAKLKANGNGTSHTVVIRTPANDTASEEPTASAKKKRRPRKKYLSEAIISPDDVDDFSTSGLEPPLVDQRPFEKKRTPKGKFALSSSATPKEVKIVTSSPDVSTPDVAIATSDEAGASSSARRGLRVRTPAQQRPYFHHAKLFEEQADEVNQPGAIDREPVKAKSKLAEVSYPNTEDEVSDDDINGDFDHDSPQPTPEPRKFKGKGRAWQKQNEDEDDDYDQRPSSKKPKKQGRPRKSLPLHDRAPSGQSVQAEENNQQTSKTTVSSNSSASKPRRRSGPRKSVLSQEFVNSESEIDDAAGSVHEEAIGVEDAPVVVQKTTAAEAREEEKRKRRPKKPYLSLEYVNDDTDSDAEQMEATQPIPSPQIISSSSPIVPQSRASTPDADRAPTLKAPPKPKIRKRKSHLSEEFVREDSDSDAGPGDVGELITVTPFSDKTKRSSLGQGDTDGRTEHQLQLSAKKQTPRGKYKKNESGAGLSTPSVDQGDPEENSPTKGLKLSGRKGKTKKRGSLASFGSVD